MSVRTIGDLSGEYDGLKLEKPGAWNMRSMELESKK
jgi:hypothetical protein